MRIAIMGAGGTGGYFGAKLLSAGVDVSFIARGAHLAAMRSKGLRISGAEEMLLRDVQASDDPAHIDAVDAVLFCVKLYDTETAARAIAPLLHEHTMILTVQNGIESSDRISAVLGAGRTLAGAAYFPANIKAPGEIHYLGCVADKPHVAFGEAGGGSSDRAQALAKIFQRAGLRATVCDDTQLMLWEKFCLMAGTSAATTLTRQNIGVVRSDPDMRALLASAISETAQVARALGVALHADTEQRVLASLDGNPPNSRASQLTDLERGRRLELDGLSGALVRLGREHGVPTPTHSTVYAGLKAFINGASDA
jgi:2-dehydropantoate 2-reductase